MSPLCISVRVRMVVYWASASSVIFPARGQVGAIRGAIPIRLASDMFYPRLYANVALERVVRVSKSMQGGSAALGDVMTDTRFSGTAIVCQFIWMCVRTC